MPPKETELKLDADLSGLAALAEHPRLKAGRSGSVSELRSVYYDAPDGELRKAGFVLRVREENGAFVQTLKANDGALSRSQWEQPVSGPEPDPAAIAWTPAARALKGAGPLEAAFTVSVTRTTVLVDQGESRIEVALDEGRVASGETSASICEVELELKRGEPADLFELARELGDAVPLRLGVVSKSERGFSLGRAPTEAAKAEDVAMHDEMSAAEAFSAIVQSCLRQIRLNESALLAHRDVELLHQMRVGVRRLRSAFSLFGDLVDDARSNILREDLKRLSEPLGRARDLDVMLTQTLPAERERRPDEPGLLNLEKTLETERDAAYVAVDALLASHAWRTLLLELFEWSCAGSWLSPDGKKQKMRLAQPARAYAFEQLEKRRRQVKKRGRKIDAISAERRHEVRIAAKKLRYGAEFFEGLYDGKKAAKGRKTFLKALKRLQDELGDLNDIATAEDMMRERATRPGGVRSSVFAAGLTVADAEFETGPLLARARKAYDALIDAKPFWR